MIKTIIEDGVVVLESASGIRYVVGELSEVDGDMIDAMIDFVSEHLDDTPDDNENCIESNAVNFNDV